MIDTIKKELKGIEEKENLKILFACESGSKAWGFPSQDSDYDVRFIYIRPIEWYLSIDDKKDTLEYPINDLLDISGWDVRKALKLFRSSNAVIYEWLQSPVVYNKETDFAEQLVKLFPEYFSLRAGMHHYLSMAKKCYKEELTEDMVKLKKYFYALRPALACKWIVEKNEVPPMEFSSLRQLIKGEKELNGIIDDLLLQKQEGTEKDMIASINPLNSFIEREIKGGEAFSLELEKTKGNTEDLNKLFHQLLN